MGCQDDFDGLGAARVTAGRSGKEPDASFIPCTLPAGRSEDWPTVVVEVGFSESSVKKLRADAAWWIVETNGDVNVVLAVHISPGRPDIMIERWQPVLQTGREGRPILRAEIAQTIRVTRQNNAVVATSSLTIAFDRIFLRHPIISPQEHDIVVSAQALENMAVKVWHYAGL